MVTKSENSSRILEQSLRTGLIKGIDYKRIVYAVATGYTVLFALGKGFWAGNKWKNNGMLNNVLNDMLKRNISDIILIE